jgi:Tfp pilus assembly protein PilO
MSSQAPLPSDRGVTVLRRFFIIGMPLMVLIILAGGYMVLLRPAFAESRALGVREGVVSNIDELDAHQKSIEASMSQVAQYQKLLDRVDYALPNTEDIPGLFATIDAASQRTGVVASSVNVSRSVMRDQDPKLRGVTVLTVEVTLNGLTYDQLKAFAHVLGASERIVDISSIRFAPASLLGTIRARSYALIPIEGAK